MSDKIFIVNAPAFGAYYDYSMLDSFSDKIKKRIVYIASEYTYEKLNFPKGITRRIFFFRISTSLRKFIAVKKILTAVKGVEYAVEVFFLLIYILIVHPAVVHFIWLPVPVVDLFLIRIIKLLNVRVIYTAHNALPHDTGARYINLFEQIYNEVCKVICLTEKEKQRVVEVSGINPEKVCVIPHGDYNFIMKESSMNVKLYEDLKKIFNSQKVILFLGIIKPYKGIPELINSFELVSKKFPDARLIIAGKPFSLNYKQYIEKKIMESGVADFIYTDFRYVPIEDVLAYLHIAYIGVLPYVEASQSGSIITFYSAGVPVVSTDAGALPEMVEDGKSGLLVPPGNEELMSNAIVSMLLHPGERERMSKNAKLMIEEKFNWKKLIVQLEGLYDSSQ